MNVNGITAHVSPYTNTGRKETRDHKKYQSNIAKGAASVAYGANSFFGI